MQVSKNGKAHLKCITSHSPFLEVNRFWLFRGTLLNESGTHFATYTHELNPKSIWPATEMSLWMRNVSDPHFGKYSCFVNSSIGMSWRTIHLVRMEKEIGICVTLIKSQKLNRVLVIRCDVSASAMVSGLFQSTTTMTKVGFCFIGSLGTAHFPRIS